jgi:hypothetical protein
MLNLEINKQVIKRFKINESLRGIIDEYVQYIKGEDFLFPSKKTENPIGRV